MAPNKNRQTSPATATGQLKTGGIQSRIPSPAGKRLRQQTQNQQSTGTTQKTTRHNMINTAVICLGAQKPKSQVPSASIGVGLRGNAIKKLPLKAKGHAAQSKMSSTQIKVKQEKDSNDAKAVEEVGKEELAVKRKSLVKKLREEVRKLLTKQKPIAGPKKNSNTKTTKEEDNKKSQITKKAQKPMKNTNEELEEQLSSSTIRKNEDISGKATISPKGRKLNVRNKSGKRKEEKLSLLNERLKIQNLSVETLLSPESAKAIKHQGSKTNTSKTKSKIDKLALLNASVKINSSSVETLLSPQEVKMLQREKPKAEINKKAETIPEEKIVNSTKVELLKSSPNNKNIIKKPKKIVKKTNTPEQPIDTSPSTSQETPKNNTRTGNKAVKPQKSIKLKTTTRTSQPTPENLKQREKNLSKPTLPKKTYKYQSRPSRPITPVVQKRVKDVLHQKRVLENMIEEHKKLRNERQIIAKEMEGMQVFFNDMRSKLRSSVGKLLETRGFNYQVPTTTAKPTKWKKTVQKRKIEARKTTGNQSTVQMKELPGHPMLGQKN